VAAQVDTVECLEPLAGEEAEPEVKRHAGTPEVLFESARRLEEDLLKDVTRVNPLVKAVVKPERDHPLQALAVALEELTHRARIAGTSAIEDSLDLRLFHLDFP